MEATNSKKLKNLTVDTPDLQLSKLFGSYKAEWLEEKLYDLFTEPAYFPELVTTRPCVLIGGRGTGKTTVLRCLSYEGQFALSGFDTESILKWPYYGMYYRVNTNRVTAFKGPELEESQWIRLFAHYFNLLVCHILLTFLEWYQRHLPGNVELDGNACLKIARSLNLQNANSIGEIANQIDLLRVEFEAFINNVVDEPRPLLSAQGAPIDTLIESIQKLPQFKNKSFFILLDEYENFENYQQQVVNTLVKHSGQSYSFKIGVRELGLRCRTTLNENEQLIHPADYVKINIPEKLSDEKFNDFALSVCNARISRLQFDDKVKLQNISLSLPRLSEDKEAEKLGVSDKCELLKNELKSYVTDEQLSIINDLSPLEAYFIQFWAESQDQHIKDTFQNFVDNQSEWKTRYQNYKHALLFTLRRGKRGIRKYYSGWDVFVKLASNNIRYLLELVDQSLLLHIRKDGKLTQPVPAETQTLAAQNVGKKNLSELEGLSVHGAKLTKLLLGLGRIYQVMAVDLPGHAPEVNQFHLSDNGNLSEHQWEEVEQLLSSAVMHLALVRFPGSKLADETETKDYEYMVHPIFTPFFVYSHRRKRKMVLTGQQLLGLISTPKETIKKILIQSNRSAEENLPVQLRLFEGYYGSSS